MPGEGRRTDSPEDNGGNRVLERYVAGLLGIPKEAVTLVHGERSCEKSLEI